MKRLHTARSTWSKSKEGLRSRIDLKRRYIQNISKSILDHKASEDLDYGIVLKQVSIYLIRRILQHCFAVKLQKMFCGLCNCTRLFPVAGLTRLKEVGWCNYDSQSLQTVPLKVNWLMQSGSFQTIPVHYSTLLYWSVNVFITFKGGANFY